MFADFSQLCLFERETPQEGTKLNPAKTCIFPSLWVSLSSSPFPRPPLLQVFLFSFFRIFYRWIFSVAAQMPFLSVFFCGFGFCCNLKKLKTLCFAESRSIVYRTFIIPYLYDCSCYDKKIGKGGDWGKGVRERETDQEGEMPIFVGFYFSPSWRGVSLASLAMVKTSLLSSSKTKILTHISSSVITYPSLSRQITPTRSSGAAFDNIRTRLNSGFNYRSDKYRVSHSIRQSFNVFSTPDLTIEAHHPTFPFGVLKVSPCHYQFVTTTLNLPFIK